MAAMIMNCCSLFRRVELIALPAELQERQLLALVQLQPSVKSFFCVRKGEKIRSELEAGIPSAEIERISLLTVIQ